MKFTAISLFFAKVLRRPPYALDDIEETMAGLERLAMQRKVEGLTVAAALVRAYRHEKFDLDLSPLAEKIERIAAYITEEINGKTINPTPTEPGSGDQRPLVDSIHPGASSLFPRKDPSQAAPLGGLQQGAPGYGGSDPAASQGASRGCLSQSPEKGGA